MRALFFIRSLFATFISLVVTGFFSILMILGSVVWAHRGFQDWIVKTWSFCMLWLFNINLQIEGEENIPTGQGAVYLFNHASLLDIPVVISSLGPISLRFGAKIELFKIPFFGRAMRMSDVLPITRSDRAKVMRVYQRNHEKLANGLNFALAPEGGRTEGQKIEDFKSGPFIFALSGGHPLVPLVLNGVEDVLPKTGFLPGWKKWRHQVKVTILPPVVTKGVSVEDRAEIKNVVKDQMSIVFEQNKGACL